MKRPIAWRRVSIVTSTLCIVTGTCLRAQTAPAPAKEDDEQTIVLSPFTVEASEDAGSYQAKSTLAGTRVRTDLKDVASAISVVTQKFLQDTGATNNESLLQYTTSTEVGGVLGNFSGVAGGSQFHEETNLLRPQQNTRVRGLDSADNTRDYFLTDIPWDNYNVDRVDLQRGPNSILFGVGSPAGIINSSVNTAGFKTGGKFTTRIDRWGSWRNTLDYNYVLIPNQLSIRFAALRDDSKYQQKPAFNNDHRLFGAVRYVPKIFGESAHTEIRANFEYGDVSADRPRIMPPVDDITPWFTSAGKVSMKASDDPANIAALKANPWIQTTVSRPGRLYWNDVLAYYGDTNNSTPSILMQPAASGANGIGSNGTTDTGIGGLLSNLPSALATYSGYAKNAGLVGYPNYVDKTLSDRSVFDFFNKLIDGRNSYEWQKWSAGNVAIDQTFFDGRLGFNLVYDGQRYKDGARRFLGNSDTYRIGIDIMTTLANGATNPNYGRPYVSNSAEQNNGETWINRDGERLTVTGELRASDLFGRDSLLTALIGRHDITALISEDQKRQRDSSWATSAATTDYPQLFGAATSLTAHFRSYDYIAYLGSSLATASSAAGANLSNVQDIITAPKSALVTYFDNHWAKSTTPSNPNYVDPAAAYTYVDGAGRTIVSTQSENPANYGGWKNTTVNFLNADTGDRNALITNDTKTRTTVKSKAITWQGHMLDDSFIPVFGWRRDEIWNAAGAGTADTLTGIVNTNYGYGTDAMSNHFAAGESKSWGGVLRLPQKWADKLPGGTNISVFYDRSQNFKADAPRGDLFGNQIPNPTGKTKEYGFTISTLNDKVTLKVDWYQTQVANATLTGGGLGGNGYYLWAVPVWGTSFTVNAYEGLKGNNAANEWAWNYASTDNGNTAKPGNPAFDNDPVTVAEMNSIVDWAKNLPLPQSFFNAYGNEVALINVSALHALNFTAADPIWNQKFDNQPTGGGLVGFSGGPQISVDTTSKGQEFELGAQPTKNWNVTVNVAKTYASKDAIAPTIASYISQMTSFLAGPAGDIRLWGGGASNAFRIQWHDNITVPYQTLLAQRGSNTPEVAPWRFNAVTTYSFDKGALKGAFIGGGYRFEDKRVLAYGLKSNGDIDINLPRYGPTDNHIDLWFGYERKITHKIKWRIQANMRNVGEGAKLVPVALEPDGSPGLSRIQEGMLWQLTNTFEF